MALGNMLSRIVSNSHFGKRRWARDMTILGFHVGPDIPNIGYLGADGGIWKYMKVYDGICGYVAATMSSFEGI